MHGSWYWTIPGIPDVETRYAMTLAVLATAVMISYAFFMTPSHRYRLLTSWASLFPPRKPLSAISGEPEPLSEKDAPVDPLSSTCNEDFTLADRTGSPLEDSQTATDLIAKHRASSAESEPQVPHSPAPPQSGSRAARPEPRLELGTDVSDSEESKTEEPQLGFPELDTVFADVTPAAHSEVKLRVSSPDAAEEPPAVEIPETGCATSENMSDGSHGPPLNVGSAECLVAVSGLSPPQNLAPTDMDASMLSMEVPFLLSVGGGSSMDGGLHLDTERLAKDDTVAASLFTGGVPAETAFAQVLCSTPDPLHGDIPSDIMHSALLVPTPPVADDDESSHEIAVGLEEDDDWTSVEPDESSTPRPSSPTELQYGMMEGEGVTRNEENDLAVSVVLLTQSQYASVILSPNTTAGNLPSPASPTSSTSSWGVRPRVHTSDKPDWAIAPQEKEEDDVRRERTQRRHSVDTPNWAVAPPEDSGGGIKKKGRRSDPGSGARKKPRRAWASR